jgi:hypothetical protein
MKKFMDGRVTPLELHARLAFPLNSKCHYCGKPPTAKLTSFAEEDEMLKRDPALRVHKTAEPARYSQMRAKFKPGWFLRINTVYSCRDCLPSAEKAAAKLPSWIFVDIDRGPKDIPIVSGYGS